MADSRSNTLPTYSYTKPHTLKGDSHFFLILFARTTYGFIYG